MSNITNYTLSEAYCPAPVDMSKDYVDITNSITNPISYILYDYWIEESDPRVKGYWLFDGNPAPFVILMLSWLLFVKKLGPNFMRDRKPYELRELMMIYNFILVVINIYGVYVSFKWLHFGRKVFDVKLPDKHIITPEIENEISEKMIIFYSKLIDLLDTVFFVLRKKSNQISFLHVYHHFLVPVLGWTAFSLNSIQSCIFGVFVSLNSTVHVIMYSYYLLSAFGPQIQPYLWWKRYITRLQLIQFAILIVYAIILFTVMDLSDYPIAIKWIVIVQPFIFFYMFFKFYFKTYKHKIKFIKRI
ncbi:unnamed protein product [Oppiella nova]|uniref:Elongation of very long chain fatty acids protein n=1 Tax=Oppiella nova TaxID=334625 RepID=A0A7R9QLA1_9ACAR|nr:unnamed protein product [Oppiella nova]CAG2167534.1 unnamed protein product [Oppiella nova]